MKNQEIKQPSLEQVQAAYQNAGNSPEIQALLRTLYGDAVEQGATDNRPVTERIKTFEDAMRELGDDHPLVVQFDEIFANHLDGANQHDSADLLAYLQLRIVCAALNEGWEPEFTESEVRWYPWHLLWTTDELASKSDEWKRDRHLLSSGDYQTEYAGFAYAASISAPSTTYAYIGSRLCLKSEALAVYCGKQFIELWADYRLIRRR